MPLPIPAGDFAGYIFDCDGTLADTMPLHYRAWCAALAGREHEFPEAFFYELGGTPTEKIVEILNERHPHRPPMPVAATARHKETLFLEMIPEILPIEPVVALARELYGKKPLAVASGGHRAIVEKTLAALGIAGLFQTIVGAEDYRHGKPAPDPFLEAARRLGVPPEHCLAFEDTQAGIASAKAAGMQTVLVPSPQRGDTGLPTD